MKVERILSINNKETQSPASNDAGANIGKSKKKRKETENNDPLLRDGYLFYQLSRAGLHSQHINQMALRISKASSCALACAAATK